MTRGEAQARRDIDRGRLMRSVTPADWQDTAMGAFATHVGIQLGHDFSGYEELWSWSVAEPESFWRAIVEFFDLGVAGIPTTIIDGVMPSVAWMPGATVNYAREALRFTGPGEAIIAMSQTREDVTLSWTELRDQVASCQAGLTRLGVERGDAVAAYMPNIPETVVLFFATASLGAVFASCPPEFGVRAVIDRLSQLAPKVLVATDGYTYGKRIVDRTAPIADLLTALPGLDALVVHEYVALDVTTLRTTAGARWHTWEDLLAEPPGLLGFAEVPFDHPLYVLFSSGSTGRPKAIVHGHGGILLEHAKALGLHNDVRPGDRFFWFATTGWMVWNYAVSALLHGATMVCYDGNPSYPDGMELWRAADRVGATFFGTSATHIVHSAAQNLAPARELAFHSLRGIGSTGSPLPADGFEWLEHSVSHTAHLSSVSGGTDVCSGFLGGAPLVPTRAGELSAPMLGCKAVALDESGNEVIGAFGELCITQPMPSMPLRFLDDPSGERFHDAYFTKFPGVWAHGDWVKFFADRAAVVSGRSDTTLNRGGVRLGTADIYSVVDALGPIDDSLVVHLEDPRGGAGTLLLLLAGAQVPESGRVAIETLVVSELRGQLSPRHVPDEIIWLNALPRTLTGKKLETPIKQMLLGAEPGDVASADSLKDPTVFADVAQWARSYEHAT